MIKKKEEYSIIRKDVLKNNVKIPNVHGWKRVILRFGIHNKNYDNKDVYI